MTSSPVSRAERPRLLDLFCGAGGAARGYQRAGFYVVGVDINPQPRYAGDEFIQADALSFPLSGFDAIHASPPCQSYSSLKGLTTNERPRLIDEVRSRLLLLAEVPWVIENVVGSTLINPITLCGSSFGLGVWRHRRFELSDPPLMVPQCEHTLCPEPLDVTGTGGPFAGVRKAPGGGVSRKPSSIAQARHAMGIDWMTRAELNQAIPPAYTRWIGLQMVDLITQRSAA